MALVLDLSGQVAIVTGGGTGIGLATAEELAKAGADITVCGNALEPLERAAERISETSGRRCIAALADVREPADIQVALDKTLAEFGRVDILVNNAGGGFKACASDITLNGWDAVLKTNLQSCFLFSQAVGNLMLKQKRGNIINVASVVGRYGGPVHYAAAKWSFS